MNKLLLKKLMSNYSNKILCVLFYFHLLIIISYYKESNLGPPFTISLPAFSSKAWKF